MTVEQQLTELINQKNKLAENLTTMGVDASNEEKLNTLVPKILEISTTNNNIEYIEEIPEIWNTANSNYPISFLNCIKKIIIPEGFTTLISLSFASDKWSNLKEIILPSTITTIKGSALFGTYVEELIIPENVTQFGEDGKNSPVANCNSLTKLIFLTRNCVFGDHSTAPWTTIPTQIVIYGYKGSTAETYANAQGNTFVTLD